LAHVEDFNGDEALKAFKSHKELQEMIKFYDKPKSKDQFGWWVGDAKESHELSVNMMNGEEEGYEDYDWVLETGEGDFIAGIAKGKKEVLLEAKAKNSNVDLDKLVKYKEPNDEIEKELIFKVVNYNDATNRVYIEAQNMEGYEKLKPQFLVSVDDIENVNESSGDDYKVYHDTYGSALDEIISYAEKKNLEVDMDDYDTHFLDALFKPKKGETKSELLGLTKDGKEQKSALAVQIHNMGTKFELNMYVN